MRTKCKKTGENRKCCIREINTVKCRKEMGCALMTIHEKGYAKLNYSLDVRAKRTDGYHDLTMVMGSVSLWDDVEVSLRSDGQIEARCSLPWLPRDERNLAVRAARVFFDAMNDPLCGADIRIKKRVPVGAGMAGGSTDAAAVLRALNALTGMNFSVERLRDLALAVGSDVPYCITGGMMLAEGRGEVLSPLPELPGGWIVICKPPFSVSTAELFGRIDKRRITAHPDTQGLCAALRAGDLSGVARRMYNVFEEALPRSSAEIGSIRGTLLGAGALGAVMTGTGSAVFGVFEDRAAAAAAHDGLSRTYRECFLVRPVDMLKMGKS